MVGSKPRSAVFVRTTQISPASRKCRIRALSVGARYACLATPWMPSWKGSPAEWAMRSFTRMPVRLVGQRTANGEDMKIVASARPERPKDSIASTEKVRTIAGGLDRGSPRLDLPLLRRRGLVHLILRGARKHGDQLGHCAVGRDVDDH